MPRHIFRWRYRLEQIEGTAKLDRALRLLRLDGSEEFFEALGFTLDDLERLARGELDARDALEAARQRRPTPDDPPPASGRNS